MRVMEHDSRARGEKRRKDREEASRIKDEGNAAFKAGDYEQAVDLYSKVPCPYFSIKLYQKWVLNRYLMFNLYILKDN